MSVLGNAAIYRTDVRQFQRRVDIQVHDIIIRNLDMTFNITKTLTKDPNKCEIKIYNLNEDHRHQLAMQKSGVIAQISAGYERPGSNEENRDPLGPLWEGDNYWKYMTGLTDNIEEFGVIFLGDLSEVFSGYSQPDWITVISTNDGEQATRYDRYNVAVKGKGSLSQSLKKMLGNSSLNPGNALKQVYEMAKEGKYEEAYDKFNDSFISTGSLTKEIRNAFKNVGYGMSIQGNTIQVLKPGETIGDFSVRLASDTGLIGTPIISNETITVQNKNDKKGEKKKKVKKKMIKCVALLNHRIIPGRGITIISDVFVEGECNARVERVDYVGSTFGEDWYCKIEASVL
ncbi:MAG: hypothetical protein JRD89_09235 [Deltaproteobacteria bacterium]|nr:hypothetical protein [Deltaproteobacteria bacterium]